MNAAFLFLLPLQCFQYYLFIDNPSYNVSIFIIFLTELMTSQLLIKRG